MKTSNFSNNQRYALNGISISRYPSARIGFKGPEFPPLMPPKDLLSSYKAGEIDWEGYSDIYMSQLNCLDVHATWDHLHEISRLIGSQEPILLCYESAKTLAENPCHRRLVATWFQYRVEGVFIPEWEREDGAA